jgi:nucleoside-diphosphate-sugar epimerase
MRIILTGAAGFLGSHLADELLKREYEVLGIDNFFRGKEENLPNHKNFEFEKLDLVTQKFELQEVINSYKPEMIIHYAAINGTQYFYDIPYKVFNDNLLMTQNLLNCVENTFVGKIVYASSSEVYGDDPPTPTKEEFPIILNIDANRDSYASSKALGEFCIKMFCQKNNINYLILRPFNTYGTRMDHTKYGQVIPEFFRKLEHDNEFTIIGDGTNTRSFCHVHDHKEIVARLCECTNNEVINVGSDEEVTINYLAKIMHDIVGKNFNPKYLPAREYDTIKRRPDILKLRSFIKEHKFITLKKGLESLIK